MKTKTAKLSKVQSISDLFQRAASDERYAKLAVIAAKNLGGNIKEGDLKGARQWLEMNQMEAGDDSGAGIVDEINFCRDLVKDDAPAPVAPATTPAAPGFQTPHEGAKPQAKEKKATSKRADRFTWQKGEVTIRPATDEEKKAVQPSATLPKRENRPILREIG